MSDYNNCGLTEEQVKLNRKKYGSNALKIKKENTFISLLLESLGDPIIKILLIALAIKVLFLFEGSDWYETIGIVIAIFVASFISSISEYGSEKAFSKLQEETSKIKCKVIRDSNTIEISIDDIVVGDVVILEAGDRVPADGILIKGELSIDESMLNGETKENNKNLSNNNKVFKGTIVVNNEGIIKVTDVGEKTIYGRLAKELQEKQADSPLKLRLRHLAGLISKVGYIAAFCASISYLFSVIVIKNNFDIRLIKEMFSNLPVISSHILYALTLSVTIIVVAVPEGLPMMITLVLSSNMKRMLKDNVLVRKLVGIETAGSLNILFTDKTGTLTKGKLEVVEVVDGKLNKYRNIEEVKKNPRYLEMLKLSMIANNASYYNKEENKIIGGNITDRAIKSFVKECGEPSVKIEEKIPFSSKNKYSIARINTKNGKLNLIKGSPEKILPNCKTYYTEIATKRSLTNRVEIENKIEDATKSGIRALVLATSEELNIENLNNLTFVALIFIKDEIRPDAVQGVDLVKNAHIKTVMVTGDNKETAIAIGKEVGLLDSPNDIVLTSDELNRLTDIELMQKIPNLKIVARSLPQDKSRLVRVCQSMDLVVGMTGDGVNDAPALKKADVGFAMGSGTEVAKEASDIVILDDNFLSISKAILFGRTVFKSIRKFIILQLTINLCAISLSIIGPFIGISTPVTVIQMLWVNMVMDTLAGLAFAYEPPVIEYMKERPKKKNESIINKYMISEIIFTGIYSAILCILFLKLPFIKSLFRGNMYLMTAFFGLFIFIDIFNSLNARTSRINILANILKNKVFIFIMLFIFMTQIILIYYGGEVFRTFGLNFKELIIMLSLAFTVIPIDWIRKIYFKKKNIIASV